MSELRAILVMVLALLAGCAHPPATERAGEAAVSLWPSVWRLQDLHGTAPLDRVEVTLEFLEGGKVAGRASCNRFFGTVKVAGEAVAFGALGSTRMACAEAIDRQEMRYLRSLQNAMRYTADASTLTLYVKGEDRPLRFVRAR